MTTIKDDIYECVVVFLFGYGIAAIIVGALDHGFWFVAANVSAVAIATVMSALMRERSSSDMEGGGE